jgi:hypothetical protein
MSRVEIQFLSQVLHVPHTEPRFRVPADHKPIICHAGQAEHLRAVTDRAINRTTLIYIEAALACTYFAGALEGLEGRGRRGHGRVQGPHGDVSVRAAGPDLLRFFEEEQPVDLPLMRLPAARLVNRTAMMTYMYARTQNTGRHIGRKTGQCGFAHLRKISSEGRSRM